MLKNIFKWKEFENEKVEVKTKTEYLTDEERRKIIEEEALRAEIRNKKNFSFIDYIYKFIAYIMLVFGIGAGAIIIAGMIIGD